MKNLFVLSVAALLLAACSSAPTQRTVNFQDGSSMILPSNWDVVPGDDTMPNAALAMAPAENGYRSQFRLDSRKSFKDMEKTEVIANLKESLENRKGILGEPRLMEISGEPAVFFAWKKRESGTENDFMTADITHFGYLVCDGENIYSLDFAALATSAAELKAEVVDEAVASFRTAAAAARQREAQLKAQEEFAASERKAKAKAKAKAKQKEEAFGDEEAFDAAEKEAAAIEKEVEKELEEEKFQAEVKETEVDGRAAARARVEAARKAAQEAQDAAVASARAAKAAAREAQEKAEALSAAQMELDNLNGDGFVQIQEKEVVVEKEIPATPAQPIQTTQPSQPSFSIENKVTVTAQPQEVMEVKVTAPQQTEPAAPAAPQQPAAPAAPQTSPMRRSNGQLVIEMQTVN